MQLHVNDIRNLQGRMVDLVRKHKITIVLPKATPVKMPTEPTIKVTDYIDLMGVR